MTNAEYFESVLRKIGVLSESESASAEQSATMLEVMNDLRGELSAHGIDLGLAPQTSATATLLMNEGDREGFKYLLCTRACVEFERDLSVTIGTLAERFFDRKLRDVVNAETVPMDMRASGSGSYDVFNITTGR